MVILKCLECNKDIKRYPSTIRIRNFCSQKCKGVFNKKDINFGLWNKGLIRSEKTRNLISESLKNTYIKGRVHPLLGKKILSGFGIIKSTVI